MLELATVSLLNGVVYGLLLFMLTSGRVHSGRDMGDAPNLRGYLRRIGARPAYQAAMAKAEPQRGPMLD